MRKKYGRSQRRLTVHRRIRRKVKGSSDRPRMAVFRSLRHFYVQLVDDVTGVTLASASTLQAGDRQGSNIESARGLGKTIASEAKRRKIKSVVFDRGGYIYHGRVKAFAESARENGLRF